MFRSRFLSYVALAFVGLFAVACDMRGFRVQLPAFEDNQVRGLWIWKATPRRRPNRSNRSTVASGAPACLAPRRQAAAIRLAVLRSTISKYVGSSSEKSPRW